MIEGLIPQRQPKMRCASISANWCLTSKANGHR